MLFSWSLSPARRTLTAPPHWYRNLIAIVGTVRVARMVRIAGVIIVHVLVSVVFRRAT